MKQSKSEQLAKIIIDSIIILVWSLVLCYQITKVHYRDHYYKYIAETCLVQVNEDTCVITRPNGHVYEYEITLLKEQETFHVFTFCDNGTPKDFTDDYIVIK